MTAYPHISPEEHSIRSGANRWWLDKDGVWNHAGTMPIPEWYCLHEELGTRAFRALMGGGA